MRQELREWFALAGKTLLMIVGGILSIAALLQIIVTGDWFVRGDGFVDTFQKSAGLVLLLGLLLAVPPLAFAFRDALHEARKGHQS